MSTSMLYDVKFSFYDYATGTHPIMEHINAREVFLCIR